MADTPSPNFNETYEILDNEGGGDCFFAVLRDAFKTVKIDTSVKAIREKWRRRGSSGGGGPGGLACGF